MANKKNNKRAALGLASASVTNAKATLPPETIAAITSHPIRGYSNGIHSLMIWILLRKNMF